MIAIAAMLALACKNGGRVNAFSSVSRSLQKRVQLQVGIFSPRHSVRMMSSTEGGEVDGTPVAKQEKPAKEKKEKKEKPEKKEKVVAAAPGIEEIREARLNKLAAMREAGNKQNRSI